MYDRLHHSPPLILVNKKHTYKENTNAQFFFMLLMYYIILVHLKVTVDHQLSADDFQVLLQAAER